MSASLDQVICGSLVGNLSVLEVSEIQIFCCMFTSFDQYHVSVVEARSLLTACEKFRAPLTAKCFVLWEQLAGQCGPASVVRSPRASILALNAFRFFWPFLVSTLPTPAFSRKVQPCDLVDECGYRTSDVRRVLRSCGYGQSIFFEMPRPFLKWKARAAILQWLG